ncbi:MAG: HDOD domain-containing protein [Candidatus Aureabacteria bacterium]|nr:HDOD domain-containing protein [Candidatus Auribacterota bacterium]
MTTAEPLSPSQSRIKKIIEEILSLPTLPTVLSRVTQLMQNPKVSANEVGQAISSDQALATKILKVVNSPFYGFPSRIKTITHAIVILGFNAVKATAMSASVFSSFSKDKNETSSFNRVAFWKHSLGVGAASRVLAKKLQLKETEEAFLAGLMHDLGKMVLDQYFHEQFEQVLRLVKEKGCFIIDAEKEVMDGVSHCEIGAWLGKRWNLNEEMIQVIGNHHAPSSASHHFQITSIIHIANVLTHAIEIGNSGYDLIPKANPDAWKLLKLTSDILPEILEEIASEVRKTEIFFNMLS